MSNYLTKHWSCRQFLILLFAIGASVLAYYDPEFRGEYADLIKISIGGYLGQMQTKSTSKNREIGSTAVR